MTNEEVPTSPADAVEADACIIGISGPVHGANWPVREGAVQAGSICAHGVAGCGSGLPATEVWAYVSPGPLPTDLPVNPVTGAVKTVCIGTNQNRWAFADHCTDPALNNASCPPGGAVNHIIVWARRGNTGTYSKKGAQFTGMPDTETHCEKTPATCPLC